MWIRDSPKGVLNACIGSGIAGVIEENIQLQIKSMGRRGLPNFLQMRRTGVLHVNQCDICLLYTSRCV